MPRTPSRVLNLVLIPADPDVQATSGLEEAWEALVALGVVLPSGRPGPEAEKLGAFALMRVDRPPGPSVYGNRQGGFHVTCPRCGMALAGPFSSAARRWKGGGARSLICPGCGSEQDFTELLFAPEVGFARFALELRDVDAVSLTPDAEVQEALERALGQGYRTLATRGR